MSASITSLINCGTQLWLDSVDPELVAANFKLGATGATSNPIIISDLIKTGRFDHKLTELSKSGLTITDVAWKLTDHLVSEAETVFKPIFERTRGNDGYVSFELDPLLEDSTCELSIEERAKQYVELGIKWSAGHPNRMIKIPATAAGLASLEPLAAAGVPLNVTLIFTERQYEIARDAVWRGAQRLPHLNHFKSVYSIFVSRIDVYTAKCYSNLSQKSQGLAGIFNAKKLWKLNQKFWSQHKTPLNQQIIFASTGTKNPSDQPWKYVAALAGSDIQTNPPQTNDAVAASTNHFIRLVDQFPPDDIVVELSDTIDWQKLEDDLMADGLLKFADPQKSLLALVGQKLAGKGLDSKP